MKGLPASLLFVVINLLPAKQQDECREFVINGAAQGTTYHIQYFSDSRRVGEKEVTGILDDVDRSLSLYRANSTINNFNNSVRGVALDRHLKFVIEKALAVSRASEGIFDATVFPLVSAWGYGVKPGQTAPDFREVQQLMACVGFGKLTLTSDSLVKSFPCVKIDLDGIAQGYSVDLIAAMLERHHIANYLVELGGEIRVKGSKPADHTEFLVGVESPGSERGDSIAMKIIIGDRAVTTSGIYRKSRIEGKRRISHLIDPRTGYPIQNEMISATVVARDAITADGYDNVLMGLGLEKAKAFLAGHSELEAALFYASSGSVVNCWTTAGFLKLVQNNGTDAH